MQEVIQFASKNMVLCVGWLGLLIAVIVLTLRLIFSKAKIISNADAITLINKEDAIVVDIRSIELFNEATIVSNAINLLPTEIKEGNIAHLSKHKDRPIIIVDSNGAGCRAPAQALLKQGFARVYMIKDGVLGWTGGNIPLVHKKR